MPNYTDLHVYVLCQEAHGLYESAQVHKMTVRTLLQNGELYEHCSFLATLRLPNSSIIYKINNRVFYGGGGVPPYPVDRNIKFLNDTVAIRFVFVKSLSSNLGPKTG